VVDCELLRLNPVHDADAYYEKKTAEL